MRKAAIIGLLLITIAGLAILSGSQASESESDGPTILVELFTSEGCSSCPPADALLAELARSTADTGCSVVPLAFHVDYWNDLGWKDPFSKPSFTQRQYDYASSANMDRVYTPQMIVDGTAAFVGSNRSAAVKAIREASSEPKARLDLANAVIGPESVSFEIAGSGFTTRGAHPNVFVALTENDLQTNVPRGENAGKTLHHTGVVRALVETPVDWVAEGSFQQIVTMPLSTDWRVRRLQLVAFAQDAGSRKIAAVTATSLIR